MNQLNLFQKLAMGWLARCLVVLVLLSGGSPLYAAPMYLGQIDGSSVPGGIPTGMEPIGVALDSSNNVYVADLSNDRIIKFTTDGTYLTQWGSPGTENGQFENPTCVALDSSNNVYVADLNTYNNTYFVKKFDANGHYLTQWGSYGSGNGQFGSSIGGIAVDGSNNIYVTDVGNFRVEKFTSAGAYLKQWGINGTSNGQFGYSGPAGIAVDKSGYVYVSDSANGRVEKFDGNGNYVGQWSCQVGGDSGVEPEGIAASGSGSIYVCGSDVIVQSFSTGGGYLTQWGVYGSVISENLEAVAVDQTGNYIYVADSFNYRIQVFANNPNIIPPFITSPMTNQTVPAGINVTLDPVVAGAAPFDYQWSSNTAALAGATKASLTLTNVDLSDSGTYGLLVTNRFGSASNSIAALTVVSSIVTTQPASSLSATGGVLNGEVSIGQDTVVWFNWGADTNYGNSTATILVPDSSGTTNVSATLNGLSAGVYHYQIVATNISGIVYGDDQSFTVGFVPTVTTLSAVSAIDGTTLNASVNPNGWDTSVYFKWGVAPGLLTNSTPPTDAGTGATPLNVSSFITGLAPAKQYNYQVVASNHLGTVFGAQLAFYTAPFVSVPNENWDSVASSADGRTLVAVANSNPLLSNPGGPICISTNSGASWAIATGAPTNGLWETVACSADGRQMIAAGGGGLSHLFSIYTSSDMGVTWVSNNAPVANWQSVASSADGARLVAAAYLNQVIYLSTNSGGVWTQATNAPKVGWFSVALSADGTKLAAVANGSTNIFTSPDFGATWVSNTVPVGAPQGIQRGWSSIASSADGSKLVASSGGNGSSGYIFISTNFGENWKLTATNIVFGLTAHPWIYVASSADGSRLAAVSDEANSPLGVVITSTNSGASWTTNAVPFLAWNAVALSADGAKLVATVGYPSAGPIYVSETTPAPALNLSASDNDTLISWMVPSLDFTLQQSSDLSNWTDMTNAPVLNFTTLENQVAFPLPDGTIFFRLKH